MASPPEQEVFLLAHVGLFIVSGLLMGLCYLAYRSCDRPRSHATATVGFGFVVLGGLVATAFQQETGIDGTLSGRRILWIESVGTTLPSVGLGLLFCAITRHKP